MGRGSLRVTVRGAVHLILTVAVGIAAAVKGNNLLFAVFSALLAVFVSAVILTWVTARKMELSRVVPEAVFAGEPFSVTLRFRNGKRAFPAFALRFEDRLSHEGRPAQAQPPPVWLPSAKPGERVRGSYSIVAMTRGKAKLGPVTLTAEFPPSFARYRRTLAVEDEILVLPRRATLHRRVVNRLLSRMENLECVPVLYAPGEDEFAGLRDYRPGDNPRRIHWKMSARAPDRLLVREFEDTRVRNAVVLLDTHLPNPNDARRRLRLERSLSFAVALVEALHMESYDVTFRTFAPEPVELPLEPRAGTLLELSAVLALLRPSRTHGLAELLAGQTPRREEVYFVLCLGDEPVPEWPGAGRSILLRPADMRAAMHYDS
jgi:uncharacterized protein (DUF58 family)